MRKSVTPATSSFWKMLSQLAPCLIVMAFIASCASSEVVKRNRLVTERLPRPSKIIIPNFIANPADVSDNASAIVTQTAKNSPKMTARDIALGRKLGAAIASHLIQQINQMGLTAVKATSLSKPKVNDIVLRGYVVSLNEGDAIQRVVIGFGYGSAKLESVVEGFQMTKNGLRKLGSAKLKSEGNKTPGGGLGALSLLVTANPIGLIVGGVVKGYGELSGSSRVEGLAQTTAEAIASKLEKRFQEEGWIK